LKLCGTCGSRFSGDACFCPFDGEPLGPALGSLPPDPLIGTIVDGRYEVLSVLGEGGMGKVYRVRHRSIERLFALKVLRADFAVDGELGLRFTREAKAAASISHPSVVQITDFGSLASGQPYFVMELLVGRSLGALIAEDGPLPASRAAKLVAQIVDALVAAHAAGVVHRDLKPDNILICGRSGDDTETAKVLDFGLAKVAGQSRLTRGGLVFGTPQYMSPEQASGGTVDERTDVYALGVLMYQAFTGRVPFEGDTYMGVLTQHVYVEPKPPSVLLGAPIQPFALELLILRCLEKRPERRFASMTELQRELQRIMSSREHQVSWIDRAEPRPKVPTSPRLDVSAASEEPTLPPVRSGTRKRVLLLPVAGTAAGLGLWIVLMTRPRSVGQVTERAPPAPSASVAHASAPSPPLVPEARSLPAETAAFAESSTSSRPMVATGDRSGVREPRARKRRPGTPGEVPETFPIDTPNKQSNYSQTQEKTGDGVIVDPWSR